MSRIYFYIFLSNFGHSDRSNNVRFVVHSMCDRAVGTGSYGMSNRCECELVMLLCHPCNIY